MLFHHHHRMILGFILLLLGSVVNQTKGAFRPQHRHHNRRSSHDILPHRGLGQGETECRNSRSEYFKTDADFMPQCDSCCCGGFVESFSCEDSCSTCVGTQCTRFSFTESWKDTYGLVSHYLKGHEWCYEITRGKDKGRKYCEKVGYKSSGGIDHCQLFIDGEECAWCEYQSCAEDGEYRMVGDCTNLYVDSTVNECSGEYNGIFDSFFRFDVEDTLNCNVEEISNSGGDTFSNNGGDTGGSAASVFFSQAVWWLLGIWGVFTFGSIIV